MRDGFILSQLDGEGMRQLQLQRGQAIKETFKKTHLLKQASDATGVNTSGLRHSSNAEARTNRINTMLRPTQFTDESSVNAHQGSNPTQFTDESSVTFHQDTQVVNISDTMCPGRADSGRRTHKA